MNSAAMNRVRTALVIVVALLLAYGILTAELLGSALLAVLIGVLYLFWRLVVAHERLADAVAADGSFPDGRSPTDDEVASVDDPFDGEP